MTGRSARFLLSFVVALATGIVAVVVHVETGHVFLTHPVEKSEIRGNDDPQARDRYEWMRLHDPKSGTIPTNIRARELAFAASLPVRGLHTWPSLGKTGGVADTQVIVWSGRGPYNVGGRTRALAIDVTNPTIILAGGVSGGLWRSDDGGVTWTKTTSSLQLQSVTCITQDVRPGRTDIWYYGTGELTGNSTSGGGAPFRGDGIFKSTDGGHSWAQLPSTVSGTPQNFDQMFDYVWNIVADRSSAMDVVYAATIGGVTRSTDGGATWTPVLGGFSFNESRFTDVAITTGGVLYATMSDATMNNTSGAISRGFWRSTDGVAWTNITPVSPRWPSTTTAAYRRVVIGIAPSNENTVYVLGETPGAGLQVSYAGSVEASSFWKYTYLSGDGSGSGGTWEDRSANLPGYGPPVGDLVSQGSYDLVVKVKPDDANVVFIGGTNLYRSTDAFASKTRTAWIGGYATANNISLYAGHHPDQHALAFVPGGSTTTLFSGHDGGISKTVNSLASQVSWTSLNSGYITTQFYTIAVDHATPGDSIIMGGTQDNGTWFANSGSATYSWVNLLGGDGAYCAIANGRGSYYASFQNGTTYRLLVDDATGDYSNYTRVDPTGGSGYLFINPFALDPSSSNIMYLAAGSSLWVNSDLTGIPLGSQSTTLTNWRDLSGTTISGATITALGVSTNPPHRVYYGSHDGRVYRLDNANTAAAGTTPVDVWTSKGFPSGGFVSCIAVDPANANNAILVFSNYNIVSLFATSDAGSTWTSVAGNLEQFPDGSGNGPSARWAAILPGNSSKMYFVGTSTGLYSTQTLNGPATIWVQEGIGTIGNAVVDMMDVRSQDGLVVAATHGEGVFSATVHLSGGPLILPGATTALRQNYPNPFNSATTFEYSLLRPGFVTLRVYSITGQLIATLVTGDQSAGGHYVTWMPKGLASGVYFYRLRAPNNEFQGGDYFETRKLVLLK